MACEYKMCALYWEQKHREVLAELSETKNDHLMQVSTLEQIIYRMEKYANPLAESGCQCSACLYLRRKS